MCEDRALLDRCARGDEAALRRLVACHEALAYNLALRNLGSREDAEEVAAEAFVRLWRTAKGFRGECSVKSHLCRIVVNLCRDRVRRLKPATAPEPAAPAGFERVAEALLDLELTDRELLVLYYLDELSYEEIGAALGISYDVLKTRLVRARTRLRELLGVKP